ncbi:MAG: SUMF1/EgtB/PvdO family nonheme iron enzyme [Candidatus Brocadiaceae bacterium]|nr:SUMF1/EgtB/PvdO family nonheme iron enzyme [Candidatus Brocadiaceae bacterium]
MGWHGQIHLSVHDSINIVKRGRVESVLRGGSWNNNSNKCRCAYRNNNEPNIRNNNIGFRCASTL